MAKGRSKAKKTTKADSGGSDLLAQAIAAAATVIALVGVAKSGGGAPAQSSTLKPAGARSSGAAAAPTGVSATENSGGGADALAAPATAATGLLATVDQFQRDRIWLAFPYAVIKKFIEDKAGYLAALVAYFGFFSVFPLMLAFTSILGFVFADDPEHLQEFVDTAAGQIPVVGPSIAKNAGSLEGSGIALVVGLLLALWSGLRIVDAMQNALADVWDHPRVVRPKLLKRRLRGVVMLFVIGGGLLGSLIVSNVAALLPAIPGAGKFVIWGGTLAVSIGLYLLSFQLLTDVKMRWSELLPGAILGGFGWWMLQSFGTAYIAQQQKDATEGAYGDFAAIIALMTFLFLAAQISILAAEINVVKTRQLWPRSLSKTALAPADLRAYQYLADATQQNESYRLQVVTNSES